MPSAVQVCACHACQCQVEPEKAVKNEGQYYCSEQCAHGHANKEGCGHQGCQCS